MSEQELTPDITSSVDLGGISPGEYYQVVDRSDLSPVPEKPISIYYESYAIHGDKDSYERDEQASYASYQAGKTRNERDQKRMKRVRNALAGATAVAAAITAKDYLDVFTSGEQPYTGDESVIYAVEPIVTFITGMSAVLANDAKNRAKNRGEALEQAFRRGLKNFRYRIK